MPGFDFKFPISRLEAWLENRPLAACNVATRNTRTLRSFGERTNEPTKMTTTGMGGEWVTRCGESAAARFRQAFFFDDFQANGWSVLMVVVVVVVVVLLLLLLLGRSIHGKTNARDYTGFTCRNAHRSIIPFGWVRRWWLLLRREYQQGVVDRSGKALGCPSVERGGDATRCRW